MSTPNRAILVASLSGLLVACGTTASPSQTLPATPTPTQAPSGPQIPVGVPDFPDSVGSFPSEPPQQLVDAISALPAEGSAEAMLIAVAQVVQQLRPEEQVRFGWFLAPSGESAGGWVQITGTPDDSIAGEELTIELEGPGGTWQVVLVEAATHCKRDVDEAGQLCV